MCSLAATRQLWHTNGTRVPLGYQDEVFNTSGTIWYGTSTMVPLGTITWYQCVRTYVPLVRTKLVLEYGQHYLKNDLYHGTTCMAIL